MYNLDELVVIRAALNVISIQGQSAQKMVNLQEKTDKYIEDLEQGPPVEKI